ncbi:restriction endonuclease subunit S [Streptococcus sanguinis]|jgi:type I restriction/modification specificity protein|uniref:restriction endonuclease subunit S n=1 Tax=Streptococcus sanguinis TaxID=1305 RepID=UPI000F65F2C4|nr:restriction endonuclease subunit S [Streptococcus sanguinis]RSH99838.1 Type I restriction modification DNA specificity domain protein [Streptococcus sanguinis]RSI38896.1 Type I restriction modification DNA specificity domain protein [Streptococcus sanguinis]
MSEVSWEITSLSELGAFSRGKSKHRPRNDAKLFEGGKYPLVQTGDVKAANLYITKNDSYYNDFGLKQSKLWPAGTLCITIAANIAETAILSYPMCFPDSIVGFNANPEKSSELFVYYFFEYIKKEIQKSASGSIQDNINIDYLSKMRIKVPEKKYQDKIVELLSSIDKKILLNNQINQELKAMAKTLYDYWFVQFDFPDQNGNPYKSSGGKMVYNPDLKREIPEGWGVSKVGELQIATGKRDANFGTENGQYNFWTTANSPIKADEFSFEGKAILIAGNGNFYVNFTEGKFEAYQRTYVIQSEDENMLIFMYMACLQSVEKLRKGSNGSIIKYITIGDVNNIASPYNKKVVDEFVRIYSPLINLISKNKRQNQELIQLRDWLLPMLINGQVRVE